MEFSHATRTELKVQLNVLLEQKKQERASAPLIQVNMNDWTAVDRETKEIIQVEEEKSALNQAINVRILHASLKWTFLPDSMCLSNDFRGRTKQYIVHFNSHLPN